MYSRYGGNSNRPVRLPERYGGSMFSQSPTEPITVSKRESLPHLPRGGVEEKASPIADRMLRAEGEGETIEDVLPMPNVPTLANVTERMAEETEEKEATVPLSTTKKPPTSPINFEGLRRLLGGVGEGEQDRLLLLGLILLLSRSGEESDILLWLSLLLLCG